MLDQKVMLSLFSTHRQSWTMEQHEAYENAPHIFVKNIDSRQRRLDEANDLMRWEEESNDFWVRNRSVGYPI